MDEIHVIKLDGNKEIFSPEKLRQSLARSGAAPDVADSIVVHIAGEVREGMTTSHIYKHALDLLKKRSESPTAARYSMRRAVFELGPSGFPFEKLLGEIFKSKGYDVQVGVILSGQCVTHETDVVARKGLETILVEAKFHNNQSFKTDVKVALAVHARFLDLERAGFRDVSSPGGHCEPWLMTNTKFTEQAITFGHCVGITMVGWGYPQKGNVQDLIEEAGLHPVSCLTTLAQKEKDALYQHGIVLCKNVIDNPNLLEQAGVSRKKVDKVVNEANRLCNL